ncbi:hypothetical protein MYCTH_2313303 [Thermothelomyces thermophilus ATCC 42464]|uniref:Casein kinase II beta 2 subunit n=1 Tax=Thermothelomyces thermophilus (strain ATCC 42464 / BCRC 31852 / DSM 1799) TaxID=573729 RepID=G2Q0U5_THET4|nr:uncharacterized protein MYCTH_2313303 [Thermothelomyces thermophilus ATCC 42464]AEO53245.1 hypothetical protein MYCTH_2313303 [Thermothelomyces thermophilus ATCC 42464]
MSPLGGVWAPVALRVLRKHLVSNARMATKMLRSKLSAATRPLNAQLQPVAVRTGNARQPVHPAAWLRQQKRAGAGRWFSSANLPAAAARRFLSSSHGPAGPKPAFRFERFKLPTSTVSRAVNQLTGRAPFASTLRPNLTGGTLGRTAGGYGIPGSGRVGGVRYFSHTPAAPAQVVQNVSQAMRAFWLSGQRARFDGVGPRGEKRYRAVSATQEEARVMMAKAMLAHRHAPGAFVDFKISPTITALSPLGAMLPFAGGKERAAAATAAATLHAEGFLDVLAVDFARALQDLAAIMTDLKRLAGLGDLPVYLEKDGVLRVRFPGLDAEAVERLCDDVGVRRGVVGQDPDLDSSPAVDVALRFPFAPDAVCDRTVTSPGGSLRSRRSGSSSSSDVEDAFIVQEYEDNPWRLSVVSELEGYESMSSPSPVLSRSGEHYSDDFEGLEGIYRFLEECDRARGRFR